MKDLGSFTIPYTIGNFDFGKALCESSASINLMPLSMVKRLKFGELNPTTMSLQMADMSMAQREGILEDVLVNVGKFIFPVDFVVIDIVEDKHIPLLLGRPFLAIEAAFIDVKKGKLTLRVGIGKVHFNLSKSLKQYDVEQAQCMQIDSVTLGCKEHNYDLLKKNSFDDYIFSSFYIDDLEKKELIA